jgi:hypothetical protein
MQAGPRCGRHSLTHAAGARGCVHPDMPEQSCHHESMPLRTTQRLIPLYIATSTLHTALYCPWPAPPPHCTLRCTARGQPHLQTLPLLLLQLMASSRLSPTPATGSSARWSSRDWRGTCAGPLSSRWRSCALPRPEWHGRHEWVVQAAEWSGHSDKQLSGVGTSSGAGTLGDVSPGAWQSQYSFFGGVKVMSGAYVCQSMPWQYWKQCHHQWCSTRRLPLTEYRRVRCMRRSVGLLRSVLASRCSLQSRIIAWGAGACFCGCLRHMDGGRLGPGVASVDSHVGVTCVYLHLLNGVTWCMVSHDRPAASVQ